MKIIANKRFLEGRAVFEPDGRYLVPDGEGKFFVRNGWAVEAHPDDHGLFAPVDEALFNSDAPAGRSVLPDGETLAVNDVSSPHVGG